MTKVRAQSGKVKASIGVQSGRMIDSKEIHDGKWKWNEGGRIWKCHNDGLTMA